MSACYCHLPEKVEIFMPTVCCVTYMYMSISKQIGAVQYVQACLAQQLHNSGMCLEFHRVAFFAPLLREEQGANLLYNVMPCTAGRFCIAAARCLCDGVHKSQVIAWAAGSGSACEQAGTVMLMPSISYDEVFPLLTC